MGKVEVTREDREASWLALNAGLMPVNGELAEFVNRWFDGRETLEGPAAKTLDTIALAIATARAEGRAEERRDVVAWMRGEWAEDNRLDPQYWADHIEQAEQHIGLGKRKELR